LENSYLRKIKDICIEASYLAGELILKAFKESKDITTKDGMSTNFATETDIQSELLIIKHLNKNFPKIKIISEETNDLKVTDDPSFVIDPIDGTTNFYHGYPLIAISIGLTIKKESVVGVVYNPILNETYWAIKNEGAYMNNKKISVNKEKDITKCLLSSNFGYKRDTETLEILFKQFKNMLQLNCHGIRTTGSAVMNLVHVASGNLDAYFEKGLQSWDMAAAKIIVSEAGGYVCDMFSLKEHDINSKQIMASSHLDLAETLIELINKKD